jgi:monoamine oxidase
MIYDVIIVGGGIAGLYCAYSLSPHMNVLLLEGSERMGGRIHTYTDTRFGTIELGAGRFHDGHRLLLQLIHQLGLKHKVKTFSTGQSYPPRVIQILQRIVYAVSTRTDASKGSQTPRTPRTEASKGSQTPREGRATTTADIQVRDSMVPFMRNNHLLGFAVEKGIINHEEEEYLRGNFGYYSELVYMNALDALYTIYDIVLRPHEYYSMEGGLATITDTLVARLENKVSIRKNHMVSGIVVDQQGSFVVHCNVIDQSTRKTPEHTCDHMGNSRCEHIVGNESFRARRCILAVPKPSLMKWSLLRPVYSLLDSVITQPLCRIYAVFRPKSMDTSQKIRDYDNAPPTAGTNDDHVWFHGMQKSFVNNPLRMVIPINEDRGVIMASYTDSIYARYWNRIWEEGAAQSQGGAKAVAQTLNAWIFSWVGKHVGKSLKYLKFVFWPTGVGYWKIGADSLKVYNQVMTPLGENMHLYICGENYSWRHQQWIEGAIDTAKHVVTRILAPPLRKNKSVRPATAH